MYCDEMLTPLQVNKQNKLIQKLLNQTKKIENKNWIKNDSAIRFNSTFLS